MLRHISNLLLFPLFMSLTACMGTPPYSEKTESGLKPADFHTEIEGKQTNLYVLKNRNGMEVCITNFGGRELIVHLSASLCAYLAKKNFPKNELDNL